MTLGNDIRSEVSVVVPSLDEGDNLAAVLPGIPRAYEVVVVEGARYHRTRELLDRVRPDAVLVEQTRYGKGNALSCGFAAATGDILVMFDADGSADAREIDLFVEAVRAGADFAKGTRSGDGGSDDITALRWLGNRGLTLMANALFQVRYTDLCYGFNAFHRRILPILDLPAPGLPGARPVWGDGFEVETIINSRIARAGGLVIAEIPSWERARLDGVSNLNAWRDGRRVVRSMLRERFRPQPDPAGDPNRAVGVAAVR